MSKPYDLAICIGRYEPPHVGHLHNHLKAYELADDVAILIGSAFQPRTIKNPFTYDERKDMISNALCDNPKIDLKRIHFRPIRDFMYEETKWLSQVQETVSKIKEHIGKPNANVCIIGYEKDDSSYYLKTFPQWKFIDIGTYVEVGEHPVDATTIRELLFNNHLTMMKGVLHPTTYKWIVENFVGMNRHRMASGTRPFAELLYEYKFIEDYKAKWAVAPYPPTFNTVDAVVTQTAHILLTKRANAPGKGLWALPGGFVDPHETCQEAVIRELREETKLKIAPRTLRTSIAKEKRFDHPERSLRGRTITDAFLIELDAPIDGKLPKVRGSNETLESKWFPLSEALEMSEELFEDHHSIISMMTSRAK